MKISKFFYTILMIMAIFSCAKAHAGVKERIAYGVYKAFDVVGTIHQTLISRGPLSEKNQKLFEEVAKELGLEHIKARNTNWFPRLIGGYNSSFAVEPTCRIYFNEDALNEISDGAKRFVMAQELLFYRKHCLAKLFVWWIFGGGLTDVFTDSAQVKGYISFKPIKNDQGKETGKTIVYNDKHSVGSLIARYMTNEIPFAPSLAHLIIAQASQHYQLEADKEAILTAGISPEDGIEYMDRLYHPTTDTWPLYAQMRFCITRILSKIFSLPVLKQHAFWIPSHKDRVEQLNAFKKLINRTVIDNECSNVD